MRIKIQKGQLVIGLIFALLFGFNAYGEAITAPDLNPQIFIWLNSFGVEGRHWTPNGDVQIEIYDYPGGVLIIGPLTFTADENGKFTTTPISFFVPGMFLRATDLTTSTVKELTVPNIEISSINYETNVVEGIAPPDAPVLVDLNYGGSDGEPLTVIADSGGHWLADYDALIDIQPHHSVTAHTWDSDEDWVSNNEKPIYLHLQGGYDHDWMEFLFYSPANTISYRVLDDQGVLLASGQTPTSPTGWGYINWDNHGVELLPGYQIVGIDQRRNISDTITLQNISTTSVDYDLDYVAGTAPPDTDLKILVGIEGGGVESIHHFDIHSNISGTWSSYMATEFGYDLTLETWVYAELSDENSNTTFAALDEDYDEAINGLDNARVTFNPDQSDLDGEGVGDVDDPCPNNLENTCNPDRSGAVSIDHSGGTLLTPEGDTLVAVPTGSLSTDTSISITDTGEGYRLPDGTSAKISATPELWAVFSNFIGPAPLTITVPISVTLTWDDLNHDGVIDGLGIDEADLVVLRNGVAFTDRCELAPGCDPDNNRFAFATTVFGDFALVGEVTSHSLFLPLTTR